MDKFTSHFDKLDDPKPDPVIQILEKYLKDNDPKKINLTIGAYRDEDLKPYKLKCVDKAERHYFGRDDLDRGYPHPCGDQELCALARRCFFNENSPEIQRITSIQTLAGTGSLRVLADLLRRFLLTKSKPKVYVPDLTWANHNVIFTHSGFEVIPFNYLDHKTQLVDMEGQKEFIKNQIEENSVIVFHTCGHNPTGADFSKEQWDEMADIVASKRLFVIFDTAYHGYVSGDLSEDSYSINSFAKRGIELAICHSFAKNMGMYGERIGLLHILIADSGNQEVNKQIKERLFDLCYQIVLSLSITPLSHGANVVKYVLKNLHDEWIEELNTMVNRIKEMRCLLVNELNKINCPGDWEFLKKQKGMFAYSGLTKSQCEYLVDKKKIYLVLSGRISIAGINRENVGYIAESIKEAIANVQ